MQLCALCCDRVSRSHQHHWRKLPRLGVHTKPTSINESLNKEQQKLCFIDSKILYIYDVHLNCLLAFLCVSFSYFMAVYYCSTWRMYAWGESDARLLCDCCSGSCCGLTLFFFYFGCLVVFTKLFGGESEQNMAFFGWWYSERVGISRLESGNVINTCITNLSVKKETKIVFSISMIARYRGDNTKICPPN